MSAKRKVFVLLPIILLLLIGGAFTAVSLLLPYYIEKKILPDLGRRYSTSLTGRVYSIGFSAADLGDIVLGDRRNPAISIASIHGAYSLFSLPAGKLRRFTLNGLTIHIESTDKGLRLPGIELQENTGQETREKSMERGKGIAVPVEVEEFRVSNGRVELSYGSEKFLLPFDLQLFKIAGGPGTPQYKYVVHMLPLGEEITLSGIVDLAGNKGSLALAAESLELNRFTFLMGTMGRALNFATTSIRGEAEIDLQPLQFISANLSMAPESLQYGTTAIRFGQLPSPADAAVTLDVKRGENQYQFTAQSLVAEPLGAFLELAGSFGGIETGVRSSGDVLLRINGPAAIKSSSQRTITLESIPELRGEFSFSLQDSGTWQAQFTSLEPGQRAGKAARLQAGYGKISLQTAMPGLSVHAQGSPEADEMQVSLNIPDVKAGFDQAVVQLPEARLQAAYRQGKKSAHTMHKSTVQIALDNLKFQKSTLSGQADLSINGDILGLNGENSPLQAAGQIVISNASLSESGIGAAMHEMTGIIPWSWPQTDGKMTGDFKAPRITWRDVELGGLEADIIFTDMMYSFEGRYRSSLLQGVVAGFSGTTKMTGSGYYGEVSLQSPIAPFDTINLGLFNAALQESYFSGALGVDGFFQVTADGMKGRLQIDLQSGAFEWPEKKYEIRDIDLHMLIPALPDLRSAPAQTMHFSEAAVGNLAFSDGKITWQLEAADSVFLEEGVVHWAGGRVFTNAVRISHPMEEYVVTIFCDRLGLTEILQQFGVENARGEGTVNGRIPLRVGGDTIRFDDGYLYSSPGQGGSIKVAAFDVLSQGIPKNTPQFTQVNFAAAALKNFQYDWVKLLLNSQGEDLTLQMQMYGKPLQSLPFTYDSRTGMLQRADDSAPGISQPIRLDVNFRLPLERFLGYTGTIQDIMKKIR